MTEPTDSTSSHKVEISADGKLHSVKQESDCLVQSEIGIKTEHQDVSEFLVIPDTLCEMCPIYDIKFETEESLISIECKNLTDKLMQDPLDIADEIKAEEQFQIDLEQGRPVIEIEPTEKEKDGKLLETDGDSDSQGNGSNQLLLKNDAGCKNNKHVCSECNKTFKWKSDFDRHLYIHTGEKPFKCSVCENSFITKGNLATHMLIHSGEKPHICDLCMKAFSRKSYLDSHKLSHSGVKPFLCDVCDKSFAHKPDLVRHKRIHTGDKPYICDLCKKAFSDKTGHNRHRRLHTGEKPYSCNICNKSFADNGNLTKHKKIHKK